MNEKTKPARRYRAFISSVGTTDIHLRSPWLMAA